MGTCEGAEEVEEEVTRVGLPDMSVPTFYKPFFGRADDLATCLLAHEEMRLPGDFDYARVSGLSNEIRNKLELHRPQTLGQASRLQGMTPAAISILLVYLKRALLEAARPPA